MDMRIERLHRWRDPAMLLMLLATGFGVTYARSMMTAPDTPTLSSPYAGDLAHPEASPLQQRVEESVPLESPYVGDASLQDMVAGDDAEMRAEALALLSLVEQEIVQQDGRP